jgi:RNA polymerase subunit RPABC4/transcription elongation factor Spt4
VTTTPTPDAPVEEPVATSCPRCGAVMRPDQDWCLMCGAAVTTEISGARGWKTPIVIVGAVLAIAAITLVIAFVQLSDDADKVAQQPAATAAPAANPSPPTQPTPAPTTAAPAASPTATPAPTDTPGAGATPSPSPSAGTFADWPAGTTAYTVILWSAASRKEAERKATELQGAGAQNLGILHSDDYSSLRSGYYVVFSGQYGTNDEAQTAAQAAQGQSPGAYAKQVKPRA